MLGRHCGEWHARVGRARCTQLKGTPRALLALQRSCAHACRRNGHAGSLRPSASLWSCRRSGGSPGVRNTHPTLVHDLDDVSTRTCMVIMLMPPVFITLRYSLGTGWTAVSMMWLQVLVTAAADLRNVCSATIDFDGRFDANTGDDDPTDALFCRIDSSAASATFQDAAVASVTESLAVFACEEPSAEQAMVVATVRPLQIPSQPCPETLTRANASHGTSCNGGPTSPITPGFATRLQLASNVWYSSRPLSDSQQCSTAAAPPKSAPWPLLPCRCTLARLRIAKPSLCASARGRHKWFCWSALDRDAARSGKGPCFVKGHAHSQSTGAARAASSSAAGQAAPSA